MGLGWALAASCARDERDVQLVFSNGTGGIGADSGSSGEQGSGAPPSAPLLTVAPQAVDLGWVTVGFASRARVRITNEGAAPLPVPVIGWAAGSEADFETIQNECLTEVAPGESCEVRVQLIPSREGTLTGVLRVESASGGSAEVAMTGLGLAAGEMILVPGSGTFEDFGGVRVGTTLQGVFTVSNPSTEASGPLSFNLNRPEFVVLPPSGSASDCVPGATSLSNGQTCDLRIAFTPSERGAVETTLSSRSEGGLGSVSVTLSGRGLLPGVLGATAAQLDFDGVVLGEGAQRSVTFQNEGDEPLTLVSTGLAPSDAEGFSIQNSDCAASQLLTSGDTCSVQLEFRPPHAGEEMTAELIAEAAEGQQRQAIPLRGLGLQPGSLVVAPLTEGGNDFGPVLLQGSVVQAFQVSNPELQPSGVMSLSTSDGFEVLAPPEQGECIEGSTSLVQGQSCTVRIRFAPTRREVHRGSLTVNSALAGARSAPVIGQGIIPAAFEIAQEINFGRVFTNTPALRTLTISNAGDQPLPPPSVELTTNSEAQASAFSYETACIGPLAFGEECEISVRFAPTEAVPHWANLRLTSAPGGTATVLLLAEALVPGSLVLAVAAGTTTDFGDVAIGSVLTRTFSVTNPGNTPAGALSIRTDDNRFEVLAGDCNQGDPAGLADGSSCSFSVQFSPDTSLQAAANLSVQSLGAGQTGLELRGRGRLPADLSATADRSLGRANIGQDALTQPENQFTWTVNNAGDLPSGALQVTSDNLIEFEQTNDSCTGAQIAARGSCQMTIRFRPLEAGTRTGSIVVTDSASSDAVTLALTAVGVRLAALGQSCVNAECAEGMCTGGVCCDRECGGTCQVCSAAGVCSDQSNREQCGPGSARCFGVNSCLLPEGQACGVGGDCGSGNCERRLGGQGLNDNICCLQDCDATGQQCNAQGQCQQPTLAEGALCGRPGDLACAGGLQCKGCLGGGNRCTPPTACCGGCDEGYVCNGGACGCGAAANGRQMIDCGSGLCIQDRAEACCPSSPTCGAARPNCDSADNLCKECVTASQCPGTNRACTGGVCGCALGTKSCGDGRCIANNQCCETCTGGRTCQTNTGTCGCPGNQQFINGQCRLTQGQVCTVNGTACASGLCEASVGGGRRCCDSACGEDSLCAPDGTCSCTLTQCGNQCIDVQIDEANCGQCGNDCEGGNCIAGRCQPVILARNQINPHSITLTGAQVYWMVDSADAVSSESLLRVNKSGIGGTELLISSNLGNGGAVVISGNQAYLAVNNFNTDPEGDSFPQALRVWRANLDGTGFTPFSARGEESGDVIQALAVSGNFAYYSRGSRTIFRAPLLAQGQGGEPADVDLQAPTVATFTVANDCVFYSSFTNRAEVLRKCAPNQAATQHYLGTGDLSFSTNSNDGTQLYLAEARGIVRVPLAPGGGFQVVTPRPAGFSLLSIDTNALYYFATSPLGCVALFRANKAPPGNPVQLFPAASQCAPEAELSEPRSLAIDTAALYWLNASGTVVKLAK
jgi:hypothetical protein